MNKQGRLFLALAMIGLLLYFQQQSNKNQTPPAEQPVAQQSEAPKIPEAPKGPAPREYLVAKQNLDPALISRVTTDLIETRAIPDNMPVPDQSLIIKSFSQIGNKVLVAPILQGELLLRTRFADARSEVTQKKLRDIIPTGMRAIALDVDAVTGSAGFINQGDIVDVLATYTAGGRQLTRIIIQNVEVLARGNEYRTSNRPSGDRLIRGDAGGGILFTLKVKPEMAVKLAHIVDERGFNRFRLILKNRDDKIELRSQGVLLREVLTDKSRPQVPRGEIEATPEVEILRGLSLARESTEERISGPPEPRAIAPGAGGNNPQTPADLAARIQSPGEGQDVPPQPPPAN